MVNQKHFRQSVAKLSEQRFLGSKCGETDRAWLLGLNMVATLVSVDMSRPGKIAKKLNARHFSSENVVTVLFVLFL